MVLLHAMRGLTAALCLLFLGMPACGVKTDPVPYLQTVQPAAAETKANEPAPPAKDQEPR